MNKDYANSMQDDLISRRDALEQLCEDCRFISAQDCEYKDVCKTRRFILSLPSAEPNTKCIAQIRIDRDDMEDLVNKTVKKMVEPKTGKWKQVIPANAYECSKCGQYVMTDDIEVYKFCHGCGADMRGEE